MTRPPDAHQVVTDNLYPVGHEQLIALDAPVQPGLYILDHRPCLIGRDPTCQVIVTVYTVSRFHAQVERVGVNYVLTDKDSTNGTFVNGSPLHHAHMLTHNDHIGLGTITPILRFVRSDAPTSAPLQCSPNLQAWIDYDERAMQFYVVGQPIHLSLRQFRLLLHLYHNAGAVCTREECARAVGGPGYSIEVYTGLDEAINKLRGKLCQHIPGVTADNRRLLRKQIIVTRRGIGYVFQRQLPYVLPNTPRTDWPDHPSEPSGSVAADER